MTKRKQIKQALRKWRKKDALKHIISTKLLGEVKWSGISVIRLSRVRYDNNHESFIDCRMFQRGYDEHGKESYYPTQKGVHLSEISFMALIGGFFFEGLEDLIKGDPR